MAQNSKAIVIGGGIAGKLAARVLSDHFKEVIVLDRDKRPDGPIARKGAKQGEHLHALLHAGQHGLEQLFPGITEKFYETGAVKINSTQDLAWYHHGVWKLRYDGGYSTTLQSRPHLEWHIDQYINNIGNITYLEDQTVVQYLELDNTVFGVEVKQTDGSVQQLEGDLVVEASGSSGFTANWLSKNGVVIPQEKVKIDLCYCSQLYELSESKDRDWTIKLTYPHPPTEKLGGTISKIEGNRYIVTMMGYHQAIPEKKVLEEDGFLQTARKLPIDDIYQEIRLGTPISKPTLFRVPFITWNHYEKVKLPNRLLVIGDTICRIDPVFGQGMSLAILEALALQELLQKKPFDLAQLPATFHKRAARIIAPIWNMVITEDFRYPETTGKRPFGLAIQQWYAKQIFLLSAKDEKIYDLFIHVMNLTQPITTLFHRRVWWALVRGK